ncbi:hypothetical protein M3Y95_01126700 [Aphelenchoides besseyi]|nr:hypothetical protein M3Y95_01126700 [Aphelenchoides besseyi]
MYSKVIFLLCVSGAVTEAASSQPCDCQIVMLLDATFDVNIFGVQQFEDQKDLVKKLFSTPYFDHFERLAMGYYDYYTTLTSFKYFANEADVVNFVDSINVNPVQHTHLIRALDFVYQQNYTSISGNQINFIFFVSDFESAEVKEGRSKAKALQDSGARVVLIGHGNFKDNYVRVDLLTQVTNDPSTVFKWDQNDRMPADDYQSWFKQVLGC